MNRRKYLPFIVAAAAALPGIVVRLAGVSMPPIPTALIAGAAILAASFLLLWACDAAQADISQGLALAIVALVAVLPEYAVDIYFTWRAGRYPESDYGYYAVANMTGANRLLIGVAWGLVALVFFARFGRDVRIGKERRTEILFLALATFYAFVIPVKGSLAWYDGAVFLMLYALYIFIVSRRPCFEIDGHGPAQLLIGLPKTQRRPATAALFLFAAGAIVANAAPFCEGLVASGKLLRINEFLLIQWLAPMASEAPEFIVALMFAWRGQGGVALGSLLSAKLNQWTLLVGMIPAIFAASSGTFAHPIPFGEFQMHEILLTAAQSLLAVVILACLRFTVANALLLFALFAGQLLVPFLVQRFPETVFNLRFPAEQVHLFFSVLYITAAVAIFLERPKQMLSLVRGFEIIPTRRVSKERKVVRSARHPIAVQSCETCSWRASTGDPGAAA